MSATTEEAEAPSGPATDLEERAAKVALVLAHGWTRPTGVERAEWRYLHDLGSLPTELLFGGRGEEALGEEGAAALLDEHERLLVGPGSVPCPPYESYWRVDVPVDIRRALMGPCTEDLRTLYAQLGLEPTAASCELPDHVAVELEALAFALSQPVRERDLARRLVTDHLARWLPRFCRAVSHEAAHPFYENLASATLTSLPVLIAATEGHGGG